jgi:flagellar secretion chaperone FliS
MSGYASAKQAYTEAAVLTATPERLVVMLYEGAIGFLARGAVALRAGQPAAGMKNVQRALAIIDELNFSLDMSYGDVPEKLRSLYLFHKRRLVEACIAQDAEAIETVAELLRELGDAFAQIADGARTADAVAGA